MLQIHVDMEAGHIFFVPEIFLNTHWIQHKYIVSDKSTALSQKIECVDFITNQLIVMDSS